MIRAGEILGIVVLLVVGVAALPLLGAALVVSAVSDRIAPP